MTINDKPDINEKIEISVHSKSGVFIKSFKIRKGTNLWVFLRKNNLPIGAACSGVGVCGACNIKINHKNNPNVSPPTELEKRTLLNNKKDPNDRLACLCRVFSDLSITAEYW